MIWWVGHCPKFSGQLPTVWARHGQAGRQLRGRPASTPAGRAFDLVAHGHTGTRHAHQAGHRLRGRHTQHTHGRAGEGDGVQLLHPTAVKHTHGRAGEGHGNFPDTPHTHQVSHRLRGGPPAHQRAGRSIWWHMVCVPENLGASIPGHSQQRRGGHVSLPRPCRATRKRCGKFFLHLLRYPACRATRTEFFGGQQRQRCMA